MDNRTYKRARATFGHRMADSSNAPKRKDGNKLGLRKRFALLGVDFQRFKKWYALPSNRESK